ncbi:hypothetical protein ACFRAR_36930 [Kitasatospora sp. NPDC056651]|uniref:hypothetical protein n=1 Tax=Kitasatospora sp. NPDC056651 TaxID=3345892 RepID=UPI0036CE3FDD
MGTRREPYWHTIGTPKTLVLYRTPDRWRFAVYFEAPGGIADGFLDRPAPTCEPEPAQAALHLRAEELTHRELEVSWQPTDRPDWWTGVVTKAGPLADADR